MGSGVGAQQAKLVSRFISDVAVFDGTQVSPSTPFTKIWRIKNVGERPWPPGTKMLFVGGDQMSAALAVPLPRRVVLPGEEIDVAVDMVAPAEVGRYIGYWRLCTPGGRRFGQRVWCHIQVVDLDSSAAQDVDFEKEQEQISALMAKVEHEDGDADEDADAHASAAAPAAEVDASQVSEAEAMKEEAAQSESSASSFDSAVLVDSDPESMLAAELFGMGFSDEEMVKLAIDKNGCDLEACTRDLVASSEWVALLTDLSEMGFSDTHLNKRLMLKNNGSIKSTVKDLVSHRAA